MGGSATHTRDVVRRLVSGRSAPVVLELDLTVDPMEGVPGDPVSAALALRRSTLRGIVDGLRHARGDERVVGLAARIAACGMPLARAQEIRDAVAAFRANGGFAIAFAETFGELTGGTVPYYLACAFDEIWLAPPGDLGLTGVALETPFLRDTLDRLGIEMDVGARYEYKNALDVFVERDFTPAHLEATTRIVESCSDVIVAGIAAGRRLPETRVRELVDAGPMSAAEALKVRLVDRLGYRDEVYAAVRTRAGAPTADVRLLYLDAYRRAADRVDERVRRRLAEADGHWPDLLPAVGEVVGDRLASTLFGRWGQQGTGEATHPAELDGSSPRAVDSPDEDSPGGAEGLDAASAGSADAGRADAGSAGAASADAAGSPGHAAAGSSDAAAGSGIAARWRLGGRNVFDSRRSSRAGDSSRTRSKVVAVIHGTGPVIHGRGAGVLPFSGSVLASDAVAAAFRAAIRDDDVAAVVFRVDSPGGSYVGSDVVRREVERFRASGRPVVVSMGAVAGSGGYFVSLAADVIVAHPGTLTGSIGVLGGKQVLRGLLDKAGVRFGAVAEGENALMMSPSRPFSATERAKLDRFLDRVYEDFVGKVAEARGMTRDGVHDVARGRVWTGADAHARGLVDELGGFERAVEIAWEKAGLPVGETPRTRIVPKLSLVERVLPAKSSEEDRAAADVRAAVFGLGTAVRLAVGMGAGAGAGAGLPSPWAAHAAGAPAALAQGGWGALAAVATSLGLPAAGPMMMPPIGKIT